MAVVSAIPSSLKPSTPVIAMRGHDAADSAPVIAMRGHDAADSALPISTSFSAHFGP